MNNQSTDHEVFTCKKCQNSEIPKEMMAQSKGRVLSTCKKCRVIETTLYLKRVKPRTRVYLKERIGQVFTSKNYGDFILISVDGQNAEVKFLNTGHVLTTRLGYISKGDVADTSILPLICGWGVNDADYPVTISESKKCPIYEDWTGMVERACSAVHKRKPLVMKT